MWVALYVAIYGGFTFAGYTYILIYKQGFHHSYQVAKTYQINNFFIVYIKL